MKTDHESTTVLEHDWTAEQALARLASVDAVDRERARKVLVTLGNPAIATELAERLADDRRQVRWEASKALSQLAGRTEALNRVVIPALVSALEDEDVDVRWVASKGLISLGRHGMIAVLHGLTRRARSVDFCRSAHHVLHDLQGASLRAVLAPVLSALDSTAAPTEAPVASFLALQQLDAV